MDIKWLHGQNFPSGTRFRIWLVDPETIHHEKGVVSLGSSLSRVRGHKQTCTSRSPAPLVQFALAACSKLSGQPDGEGKSWSLVSSLPVTMGDGYRYKLKMDGGSTTVPVGPDGGWKDRTSAGRRGDPLCMERSGPMLDYIRLMGRGEWLDLCSGPREELDWKMGEKELRGRGL